MQQNPTRLSPEAVRETVAAIGGPLSVLSERICMRADHPDQAARHVAGLIALGEKHGADVLQTAVAAALSANGIPTPLSAHGWPAAEILCCQKIGQSPSVTRADKDFR